jgi:hypothetical protein
VTYPSPTVRSGHIVWTVLEDDLDAAVA